MDRRMMNQWLASQSQKKQVTEASMQRKRLGIKEAVNYGDINFRVPVDPNTGQPNYSEKTPRSPESAANLTRRLGNLAAVAGAPAGIRTPLEVERAASSLVAKGVAGGRTSDLGARGTAGVIDDLIHTIRQDKDIHAGKVPDEMRDRADTLQKAESRLARTDRRVKQEVQLDKNNTIRIGGARPGAVSADTLGLMAGVGSSVAGGMAAAAPAAVQNMAGLLTPPPNRTRQQMEKMSNSDAGLAFNVTPEGELEGDPAGMKAVRDRQKGGASFPTYYPQVNENNMMNAWLQSQSQKQQPSTRSMEQKRQGIAITEQLNAKEEAVAKSHKSMLANMVKQYGKEKGTRVFYAKVREIAKK